VPACMRTASQASHSVSPQVWPVSHLSRSSAPQTSQATGAPSSACSHHSASRPSAPSAARRRTGGSGGASTGGVPGGSRSACGMVLSSCALLGALCVLRSPWTRWWTHDTGMDRRAAVWAWRTPVVGALGDVGGDRPKAVTPLATFVALIGLAIGDGDPGLCHTSSLLRRPARRPGAWPVTAGGAREAPRSCWQG